MSIDKVHAALTELPWKLWLSKQLLIQPSISFVNQILERHSHFVFLFCLFGEIVKLSHCCMLESEWHWVV